MPEEKKKRRGGPKPNPAKVKENLLRQARWSPTSMGSNPPGVRNRDKTTTTFQMVLDGGEYRVSLTIGKKFTLKASDPDYLVALRILDGKWRRHCRLVQRRLEKYDDNISLALWNAAQMDGRSKVYRNRHDIRREALHPTPVLKVHA